MAANEQLFDASRNAPSGFTIGDLRRIRNNLLYSVSKWFHEIYEEGSSKIPDWLTDFKDMIVNRNATIISFNWDLVLDHLIFGDEISLENYGLGTATGPLLIKPHGSLNWYDERQGKNLDKLKRIELYSGMDEKIFAFTKFREPISARNRRYSPLIIPPVFNKNFTEEIFTPLWQKCVAEISIAKYVVFLGYSLPDADLHARFILRCGFYNQTEGLPGDRGRDKPTGASSVIIVNPDVAAARRIEGVIAEGGKCDWQPFTVEKWFEERARKRAD